MDATHVANQPSRTSADHDIGPLLDAMVTAGADTPDQKSWNLARPVTLIGRSKDAHIRLDEPAVEPIHAALLNTGDAIVLTDLASREGVFCDGQRVYVRLMRSGESFRLGACLMKVEANSDKNSPAQGDEAAARALELPGSMMLQVVRGAIGRWSVQQIGATIGARPGCTITLESKKVQPVHALITRVGATALLVNLAGGRSVRLNGEPVSICPLSSGDVIDIDSYSLKVGGSPCRDTDASTEQDHPPPESFYHHPCTAEAEILADSRDAEQSTVESDGSLLAGSTGMDHAQESQSPQQIGVYEPQSGSIISETPIPDVQQFESRLRQFQEQILDSSKQLKQWQQQLERYANKLILKDAELAKRARQLDELQQHLQQTEEKLYQKAQQLERSKGELDEQRQQVDAERSTLARQRDQLAERQADLDKQEQAFQVERNALQDQQANLEKIRVELDARKQQVDQQCQDLQQQAEQMQSEQLVLKDQRERIEQAEAELQQRLEDLVRQEQQCRQHRKQLAEQAAVIDSFGRVIVQAWQSFAAVLADSPVAGAPSENAQCDRGGNLADVERNHAGSRSCPLPMHRLLDRPPTPAVESADLMGTSSDSDGPRAGDIESKRTADHADTGNQPDAAEANESDTSHEMNQTLDHEADRRRAESAAAETEQDGSDGQADARGAGRPTPTSLEELDTDAREQVRMLRRLGSHKSDAELIAIVLAKRGETRPSAKRGWLRR